MNPFNERFNEIIFERKNKMYGAYVLRKEYPESLRVAILLSAAFITLMIIGGTLLRKDELKLPALPGPIQIIPDCPAIPDDPIKPTDPPKPIVKTIAPVLPKTPVAPVVADDPVKPDDPISIQISGPISDVSGKDSAGGTEINEHDFGKEVTETETNEKLPFVYVTEMPDIEGGILPFIKENLRYPSQAVENKTSGRVQLLFVVEPDGSITNINILTKRIGDGCEEEAIRVIKSAKWKPGKNNGKPARVQLSLPVVYKLQ